MKRILFFLKGMLCLAALGFAVGGGSLLMNSCTKGDLNAERQRQMAEAKKWLEILKSTSIRPPAPGDRVTGLFEAYAGDDIGGGFGDLSDSFPSRPGMNLLRVNVDNQYSESYILETRKKVDPLVKQSIAYIETYGFTEVDFVSTLGIGYDPALVCEVAAIIQAAKNDVSLDYSMMDAFPFVTRAYASGDIGYCILGALTGIDLDLVSEIRSAGSFLEMASRKAILKMVGRFAARYLSYIGAAILVYEVAGCFMAENDEVWYPLENRMDKKKEPLC